MIHQIGEVMKISLLIYSSLLIACSQNNAQLTESKLAGASKTYYLGMGYDKLLDKFKPSCVSGNVHTENQTLGHWKFSRVESWSAEKLKLGFASSFSYQTGIINADAKAQFTRDLYDSELTSTYLLNAEFISQTSFLIDSKLKDSASQLMHDRGYNAFREKCGNSYVTTSDKGEDF